MSLSKQQFIFALSSFFYQRLFFWMTKYLSNSRFKAQLKWSYKIMFNHEGSEYFLN